MASEDIKLRAQRKKNGKKRRYAHGVQKEKWQEKTLCSWSSERKNWQDRPMIDLGPGENDIIY